MLELSFMASLTIIGTTFFCIHPLTLCLNLIILASVVGLISGLIFMKWFFYSVALIFLGGMMIIFIYVTTLAGNEKFLLTTMSSVLPVLIFLTVTSSMFFTYDSMFKHEYFMAHTYSTVSVSVLFFLIVFLFSTLITVVKIAESFKGALVKFS